MNLKLKLFLLSGLAVAALAIAVVAGMHGIKGGMDGIREIGRNRLPSVLSLQALKEYQIALKSSTYEAALWENDPEAQDQFAAIAADKQKLWNRVDEVWRKYEAIPHSAEEAQQWERLVAEWTAWKKIDGELIDLFLALSRNTDAEKQKDFFLTYYALGGQQRLPYLASEKLLGELVEINARNVEQETAHAESATRLSQRLMVTVGVLALLMVLGLGTAITRSILRQMGGEPDEAVAVTRRIAEGDLSFPIHVTRGNEHSLLAALAHMQEQLRQLIGQVMASARALQESTERLSADTDRISASGVAESNAASAIAASVEQITSRINHVSESALTASQLSRQAGQLAGEGETIVENAAQEMSDISAAVLKSSGVVQELGKISQEISAIVNIIKQIADQTNLLAFNAAIEAAGAGEYGQRFAVVATEVRKLAKLTASSTGQISGMINAIQEGVASAESSMENCRTSVDTGVEMVVEVIGAMNNIHSGTGEAAEAVSGITQTLQDANRGLLEITASMEHIVTMVERNGASIDTMVDSTSRIDEQADSLMAAVQRFRL